LASCACLVISIAVLAIGGDGNNSGSDGPSLGFAGVVVAGFTVAPTTLAIGIGSSRTSSSIGSRTTTRSSSSGAVALSTAGARTSSSSLFLGPLPVAQESAGAYLAAGPPRSFAHSSSSSSSSSQQRTSGTVQQREMWNGAKEIHSFGASSSSSRGFFQQQLSPLSLASSSPSSTTTTTLFLADASSSLESLDEGATGSSGIEKQRTTIGGGTNKRNFFASLDTEETLNGATKERSALLAKMIDEKKVVPVLERRSKLFSSTSTSTATGTSVPTISYERPGSTETFLATALNPKSKAAAADSIQGRDDETTTKQHS